MQNINHNAAAKLVERRRRLINFARLEEAAAIAFIISILLLMLCLVANAAPRNPVFSVASGTTFSAPHQLAISVPFDGEIRFERGASPSNPTTSSPLYTGPLTVRWSETIKAIAVVGGSSSNVVTASYTLDANKYPAPSAGGTTAPVINLQLPTTGQ